MNIFRKIVLSVTLIGSVSYAGYVYLKGPCEESLKYTLGTFTPAFHLTEAQFLSAIKEAEAVWEKPAGKDLFSYATTSGMKVSLVYDERQALVDKNKTLEQKIDQAGDSAAAVKASLDAATAEYQQAKSAYESAAAAYQARLAAHSKNVDYWNARGGAPSAQYQALARETAALKALHATLEAQRLQVNALAARSNKLVADYNAIVKNINSNVAVINQSADKEFEQGEYVSDAKGQRINIYEFSDRATLVRVLAHELGHSLGMEHNSDPDSIMYYLNSSKKQVPSAADIASLNAVCKFKQVAQR